MARRPGDQASGSQRFFDRAGSADKTLKLYDGHFHDLLNDLGKEVVMATSEIGSMRAFPRLWGLRRGPYDQVEIIAIVFVPFLLLAIVERRTPIRVNV